MKKLIYSFLIILLIASMMAIAGCSSNNQEQNQVQDQQMQNQVQDANTQNQAVNAQQNQEQGNPNYRQWRRDSNFTRDSNLTDAQRQQMVQQRIQLAVDACQNKQENDACTIQSPRGERAGTCITNQNNQLMCRTMRNRQNASEAQPLN